MCFHVNIRNNEVSCMVCNNYSDTVGLHNKFSADKIQCHGHHNR